MHLERTIGVDDYGYPLPPTSRSKLRKNGIRTSKGIVDKGIFVLMSLVGGLLWLSRRAANLTPLDATNLSSQAYPGHSSRSYW